MPKLQPIMSSRDVDMAATLLTLGLAPTLDKMAPNKTMYTRKNSAQHMADQTKMLQAQQNSAQEKLESGDPEDWRAYRSLRYQTTASLKGDGEAWRKSKLCRWSAVKRILNWNKGGPPTKLFQNDNLLNKQTALAAAINT